LRANFQLGASSRNDNKSTSGSLAWGAPIAGGRGHFVVAAEYDRNRGIAAQWDREWTRNRCMIVANPLFQSQTATPSQPALVHACGVTMASSTDGGLIISGPLRRTQFLSGGATSTFRIGTLAQFNQAPTTLPGSGLQIGGDGTLISDIEQFRTPVRRYSTFTNTSFDISDSLQATLRMSYSNSLANGQSVQPFYATGVAPGNALAVKYGNPYIPAAVLAGLPAGVSGNTAFFLGRNNTDIGVARPTIEDTVLRASAGLNGKFGGSWSWNAYLAYGKTRYEQNIYNNFLGVNGAGTATDLNNHWLQATDTILDTATNTIACRNVAARAQGCVPANVFGNGSISAAALAYLTATQTQVQIFRQDVIAASLQGEPFNDWAGPISVAAGLEYRKESVSSTVDAWSQVNAFYLGNPKALLGSYNIREVFGEVIVPLLKDQPFAKNLDLNLAVRNADYSSSGKVTTWKGGLTYTPLDGLLLRATRSRDIRAPNLNDLFAPQQLRIATVTAPGRGSVIVTTITSGNTNLKAEEADTVTAGIALQPAAMPGFSASFDYYRIKLNGSIAAAPAQSIINGCNTGITALCSLMRSSVTGAVDPVNFDQLLLQSVNLAFVQTSGLDLELAYRLPLARLSDSGKGELNFRLLGTHVTDLTTNDGLNTPLSVSHNAAQIGLGGGVPDWNLTGVISYRIGRLGLNTQIRHINSGVYNNNINADPAKGAVNTIDDNHIPSATYVGFSGDYVLKTQQNGQRLQLYWAVDNLFDRTPPALAAASNAAYTNSAFFDVIGRSYRLGLRYTP
jgi:outer membrane receptor protein involved in Fe transport